MSPPTCLVTSQTQKCVIFDTLLCLLPISVILKCSALLVISELVLVKHFFFSPVKPSLQKLKLHGSA